MEDKRVFHSCLGEDSMPPKKKTKTSAGSSPKPKRAVAFKKTTKAPLRSSSSEGRAVKKTAALSLRQGSGRQAKVVKSPTKIIKTVGIKKTVKSPKVPLKVDTALKKLPRRGETRLVAFIRDPQCLFTYWEVTPESVEVAKKQLGELYKGSSMVLRVFHTGPNGEDELLYEVTVEPDAMNRYLEIPGTGNGYFVEIARRSVAGRLVVFARSNRIPALISSFPSMSSAGGSAGEMPAGLRDYFSQNGEEEFLLTPGGISSAESLKRKRNQTFSSFH
jgi:hypothetical protein